MRPFIARATVFFNGDFFQIVTQSTGMIAYGEPDAPLHYLPPDVDDTVLGKTLREALKVSKQVSAEEFQRIWSSGVLEKNESERDAWTMQHYGYKTKRAMYKNMGICSVEVTEGRIKIQPTQQTAMDGSFTVKKDTGPFPIYLPESASDAELGAALREGFARCTSALK